MKVCLKQMI